MINSFTEEELESLNQSPYVEHIGEKKMIYGKIFDREYHRLFSSGYTSEECFEFLGLEPAIMGKHRMKSYHTRYVNRVKNDDFNTSEAGLKRMTISQELEEKDHRIKLLEQELTFLKKKMLLSHQYTQQKDSNDTTSD